MITLKKIQGSQFRRLLSPLLRLGSHGAAVWRLDSFAVEASTESVTVQLRLEPGCFDHYACSGTTGTWLNLHHLDRIFSSTAGDESLIMSAITSANHMATNINFIYEHHGMFTAETNLRGCIIPHHHRSVNVSVLSYQVLVGISSWDFRRIIWHFAEQGTQFVQAHITNGQVRFLSGFFEDIVLTVESGGCIILNGSGHSGEFIIRINMHENVYAYISAAEHSTHMVWLHHSRVNAPDKILILVTEFIYFQFYMNG